MLLQTTPEIWSHVRLKRSKENFQGYKDSFPEGDISSCEKQRSAMNSASDEIMRISYHPDYPTFCNLGVSYVETLSIVRFELLRRRRLQIPGI
ncbi:hypothetical protein J6590_043664 [Homalodisca vitripennis]|nr:hypothetical protein J6590_043664 [Homalodisca vitripennis]